MARIRSIKPEIWRSRHVMNLSRDARLLFVGLITQADDHGRGLADPKQIKADIFPGDDVTGADIAAWLAECVAQFLVVTYDGGDKFGEIYQLVGWAEHQKINHPGGPKYPARPNGNAEHSRNVPGALQEHSSNDPGTLRNLATLIGSDLIGEDLSVSSDVTVARARGTGPDHFKKMGSERNQTGLAKRTGRNTGPRAGPGGFVPIAATAERFLVEHTPQWAKVRA